jgi:hypothetical protein
MRHRVLLLVLSIAALHVACAGTGKMPQETQSATHLDHANFRVIKAGARGEDWGFYLFGFIPIIPASLADATDKLMAGVSAEGRAVSLTNVTQEQQLLCLILFSMPKVVVRADVIEFDSRPGPAPAP